MKKTTRRIGNETVICYEVSTDEFLGKKGAIDDLKKQTQKLGATCKVYDKGEAGYVVTLTTTNKVPFWKRNGEVSRFSNSINNYECDFR